MDIAVDIAAGLVVDIPPLRLYRGYCGGELSLRAMGALSLAVKLAVGVRWGFDWRLP